MTVRKFILFTILLCFVSSFAFCASDVPILSPGRPRVVDYSGYTFSLTPSISEVYDSSLFSSYEEPEEEITTETVTESVTTSVVTEVNQITEETQTESTSHIENTENIKENATNEDSETSTVSFDSSLIENLTKNTEITENDSLLTDKVYFRVIENTPQQNFTPQPLMETEEPESTVNFDFDSVENNTFIVENEEPVPEETKITFDVDVLSAKNKSKPFVPYTKMINSLITVIFILIGLYIVYRFAKKLKLFFPSTESSQDHENLTGKEIDNKFDADKVYHAQEKKELPLSDDEILYGINRYSSIAPHGAFDYNL